MQKPIAHKINDGLAEVRSGIEDLREDRDAWARRATEAQDRALRAEAEVAAVRDLLRHAEEQSRTQDDVWQEIEDPTPIPGWVTLVRRAIGDTD